MAKKSKSAPKAEPVPPEVVEAPAAETQAAKPPKSSKAPKEKGRKKKGAEALSSHDETPVESESAVVESVADVVEEPAPPEVIEAPVEAEAPAPEAPRKRGKKKKSDAVVEDVPVETSPGATTTSLPALDESEAAAIVAAAAVNETGAEAPAETSGEPAADVPPAVVIDWDALARIVEALLFAAEEPLQARELGRCSGSDSATIRKLIPKIRERYDAERRPWDILETGTGWRMVTRPEFYPAIQRLKTQTQLRKLTQPGLETLALIAYRQPISRAEVENVRGVGAGAVLRQLLERKLIKISGRGTGLGQPLLYGTTDYFLEHFGLKTLQELPKPNEFKQ